MRILKQMAIIWAVSFVGEIIHALVPLPIPASVYGIIIMIICLKSGIVKLEWVSGVGKKLVEIMPIMFIPAAVGIMKTWDVIAPHLPVYVAVVVVTTILVMAISALATQAVERRNTDERNS